MIGSNQSIFRKGVLLVGVPIAFQLVLLAVLLELQNKAGDADRWVIHTKEVIAQAEEAQRLLIEAVSHMRGVVVSGDPNFAPEQANIADGVLPSIDRLEKLVADNPPQLQRVRDFGAGASDLLGFIALERDLISKGKNSEAVAGVKNLDGERRVRELRRQLQEMLDGEQQLDRERLEHVASIRMFSYWFIGVAAAATVCLAGIAMWIFTRDVASRLQILADNAGRLAGRRVLTNPIEGTDEIAKVDVAFRAAAVHLAQAEAAEENHRIELEQRAEELAETNAKLGRTNADLQYKTQEIETFVYSVSHDLRSPLVNLQGFSKELSHSCEALRGEASGAGVPADSQKRMVDLIDGDILESVRFIQTAVSRSGNIIDALLRLSRAGRVEYRRQRVDVKSILDRVVDAMQSTVRERGANIVIKDLPDVESDPAAVEQIFGNLVGNAVNYLDAKRPGQIEIGALTDATDDERLTRYYVRDNGMGIPAAYLSKMFVAFQRLHGDAAKGEGIGLALVRRVVERLGGTVSVESTEGEGSTFFVTLPKPGANAATGAMRPSPGAAEEIAAK